MNIKVKQALTSLQEKLMGHFTCLVYQYENLCVKANPVSLLAVKIGDTYTIEDMVDVRSHSMKDDGDEVSMDLYPKSPDYIGDTVEAIMKVHPEFKVKIMQYNENGADSASEDVEDKLPFALDKEEADEADNLYIRLTMPEVDKDRHKLLIDAIDALYDKCKANMDAELAKTTVNITTLTVSLGPEALQEAQKARDKQKDQYYDMNDKVKEAKKKEVDDAYAEYLKNHPDVDAGDFNVSDSSSAESPASATTAGYGEDPDFEDVDAGDGTSMKL